MSLSAHGPNMTKLIIKFIAREAIPIGGGIADGIEFFKNLERRKLVLAKAEADAIAAIQLIKASPDNPFGENDEDIARILLEKIEEKIKGNQPQRVKDIFPEIETCDCGQPFPENGYCQFCGAHARYGGVE